MHVAIGGLEVKGVIGFTLFQVHAIRSMIQAQKADGCLLADARQVDGIAFSLTAWRSPEAMRAYALSGAHKGAMRAQPKIGINHGFLIYEAEALPDWDDALSRWKAAKALKTAA